MNIEFILERLGVYRDELRRRRWMMLAIVMIFVVLAGTHAWLKPSIYTSDAIFHSESFSTGGVASNPLSMLLGTSLESGEGSMMIGILKSRKVRSMVADDSVMVRGSKKLVADLVLDGNSRYVGLPKLVADLIPWEDEELSLEGKIIKATKLIGRSMKVSFTDEGFIKMSNSYYQPRVTQAVSDSYINSLNEYYKKQRTEKALNNIEFFTERADSIKYELDKLKRRLARYQDENRSLVFNQDNILPMELQEELGVLQIMYNQLVAAREQSVAQLQQDIPIIYILDPPEPPFKITKSSLVLYGFLGLVFGFFLSAFLALRKHVAADIRLFLHTELEKAKKNSHAKNQADPEHEETASDYEDDEWDDD
ncbi:Wzz/FepE/Etk N-terminal domain-containing protein [Pontibacter sp. G13]|uniref:Wzz/FepE/Etk N-terminal domain-containing protein n=1 Tax=Pontibacter sp. G13 TaxID=3074898 RepID=UPI00288AD5E5|nr:Wzz/FepE/Etk N-terminal domain-containing protein [Pontibacter sp. G13]WNJ21217.1 Wzz/FepE/Etk N-terminal domain-containing protein [Pontibacter sp. G13]